MSARVQAPRSNPFFLYAARWIASIAMTVPGAHSRDRWLAMTVSHQVVLALAGFTEQAVIGLSNSARRAPDAAKMGEAESDRVFQAIAERTVDADMCQPDHRDRKH